MAFPLFAPRRENSHAATNVTTSRSFHTYAREAGALLWLALALFIALALLSFEADPLRPEVHGRNWVGPVGEIVAHWFVNWVGIVGWFVPCEFVFFAIPLLRDRRPNVDVARIGGDIVIIIVIAALVHVAFPTATAFGAMQLGGRVGELFGEILASLFSTVGSYIIGITACSLILIGRATFSFIDVARRIEQALIDIGYRLRAAFDALVAAFSRARIADQILSNSTPSESESADDAIFSALTEPSIPDSDGYNLEIAQDETSEASPATRSIVDSAPSIENVDDDTISQEEIDEPEEPKPRRKRASGPRIVDTSSASATEKGKSPRSSSNSLNGFILPSTTLLDQGHGGRIQIHEDQLKTTAQLLEKTLADYGVSGKVEEIHPGPTVTTFEVSPAAGTKVSKVASLADDLALGLSRKVRIIAPIPGKNRIGFEIPNEQRAPVNLRELIEDRRFMENHSPLPCVLGRDIIGTPYFADLSAMPHVIVAGATGAGKSVGLNVMLVSLLFRKTPQELRLLMIDPKVVELAPFDRIPHMLLPVVTDMKQASNALKWAVDEMERRYQLFANAGTKNITTYNALVERVRKGEAKPPKSPSKVSAIATDGTEVEIAAAKDGSDDVLPEKIPYIVIVVDEFADLMMQQGKDVESSVARLAQKARAAGMHVILATQRPSVDVITGMIKANFPTRIAFRVAQKVDSRTILDEQGAEHLLGRGDMLIKMNGSNDTKRVQCPFCSEEEVQHVTDFLRSQGEPVYDENIIRPREEEEAATPDASDAEKDPMYDLAVRIVAETRRCSTSWIQRKLGVGYNRAAKIVEAMEKRGLVGPANGAKDREVLISAI